MTINHSFSIVIIDSF